MALERRRDDVAAPRAAQEEEAPGDDHDEAPTPDDDHATDAHDHHDPGAHDHLSGRDDDDRGDDHHDDPRDDDHDQEEEAQGQAGSLPDRHRDLVQRTSRGAARRPYLPSGRGPRARPATGKSIMCVVTDREDGGDGRVVDLSETQFAELAPLWRGVDACQGLLVTHSRSELSELLKSHGLSPSRALGQNFVVDANTVRRIARLAEVGPGDLVLEIGRGAGRP